MFVGFAMYEIFAVFEGFALFEDFAMFEGLKEQVRLYHLCGKAIQCSMLPGAWLSQESDVAECVTPP